MIDNDTNDSIASLMDTIYTLFRAQDTYDDVARIERDVVERIQYASAIVQAEKVTPPGGWDPFGR